MAGKQIDDSFKPTENSDNDPVTVWYDKKPTSTKISVTSVGSGPVYSNTINYVHAVKFAGSNANYLQIADASFLNGTDYTIFVLEKRESASANNYFIGDSSINTANQNLILGYNSDQQVLHSQAGSNSYNSSISSYSNSSGPRVFTFISDSAQGKKTYINGTLAAQSSDTAALNNITSLAIGKGYSGQIGEIAIFTRALKTEERKSTEDYLGKKWTTKISRDLATSCVDYIVTDNGCDMSMATCSISQTGVSATVSPASSSTPLTCNILHYSGSVNYTCINGNPTVSGACTCTTGYIGTGCSTLPQSGGGGGGGAYSKITNLSLTAGASVAYSVGAGGSAGFNGSNGGAGGDTWFNGATFGASSVAAKGGSGGITTSYGAGGTSGAYAGGGGGGSGADASTYGGAGAAGIIVIKY